MQYAIWVAFLCCLGNQTAGSENDSTQTLNFQKMCLNNNVEYLSLYLSLAVLLRLKLTDTPVPGQVISVFPPPFLIRFLTKGTRLPLLFSSPKRKYRVSFLSKSAKDNNVDLFFLSFFY
jgi:hypothetical protein